MKQCSLCKEWKAKSEFGKLKMSKDGLQYSCKKCRKITQQKYISNNPDNRRNSIKRYGESEKGKASAKKHRVSTKRKDTLKRWYDSKGRKTIDKYRENNPATYQARMAVSTAVRANKVPRVHTQTCRYCPKQAEVYHHWSYKPEHWLDIIPVCRQCHANIHKAQAQ